MNKTGLISAALLALASFNANAVVIEFENIAPAGWYTNYNGNGPSEDGFDFVLDHGHLISGTFSSSSYNNHNANNGTDWLMHDSYGVLSVTSSGGPFSIQSLDYQSFGGSSGFTNVTGFFAGGGSIMTQINFTPYWDTFTFDANWTNLSSIQFQGAGFYQHAYDNFVMNETAVPAPGALALLGLGLVSLGLRRRKSDA